MLKPSRSAYTDPDCSLDGSSFELSRWPSLTATELSRIVGDQQPSDMLELATDFDWVFQLLPTSSLRTAREDGEPDEGWPAVYKQYLKNDAQAVAQGGLEYAGRDVWIKTKWAKASNIYPLFVVKDEDTDYRLLDGHRRLAGAFFYTVPSVWALVGTLKQSV